MKTRRKVKLGDTVDLLDDQDTSSIDDDITQRQEEVVTTTTLGKDTLLHPRTSYQTRQKVRLGNAVDLLDDCDADPDEDDGDQIQQEVDTRKTTDVIGRRKTRNQTRLGNTVDLSCDPNLDSDRDDAQIAEQPVQQEDTKQVQVGEVGYTFQKYFKQGWFTGTVVEIRPGAGELWMQYCIHLLQFVLMYIDYNNFL